MLPVERQDGVGGAAQFEATGGLLVLAFEAHRNTGAAAERRRIAQRGAQHLSAQAPARLQHLREAHAHAATRSASAIGCCTLVPVRVAARPAGTRVVDNTMTMPATVDPSNLVRRGSRSCCHRNNK
jgi:hypothetical protein